MYWIWVIIFIIYILIRFTYTPSHKIINYNTDESIKLLNKDITIDANDIEKIIFSQGNYMTFLWDWWDSIIVKLKKDSTKKLYWNTTQIGTFELKKILNLHRCNIKDYNTNKLISTNSNFNNDSFYYISKIDEYRWWTIIYIDEWNDLLYYCYYRN
jgi:hypothetical protein